MHLGVEEKDKQKGENFVWSDETKANFFGNDDNRTVEDSKAKNFI